MVSAGADILLCFKYSRIVMFYVKYVIPILQR